MSLFTERLRTAASLAQALPACRDAADRIEQLEAACMKAADRIDELIAALREIGEAVLAEREACAAIAAKHRHHSGLEIAELIRDQGPPPKTQPPPYNPDDWGLPPARQENDDVYPGFRGNNEA